MCHTALIQFALERFKIRLGRGRQVKVYVEFKLAELLHQQRDQLGWTGPFPTGKQMQHPQSALALAIHLGCSLPMRFRGLPESSLEFRILE